MGSNRSTWKLLAAIEEFLEKQLAVYRADQDRIDRDARTAREVIREHGDRWLLELIQNSDDANSTKVQILVTTEAVYVADDGDGFQPEAVKSVSGTHFSEKSVGTIGWKGVGFKAVYDVSRTPQILSKNEGGLEFSPEKAREWFKSNGLSYKREGIPYQWLPFQVTQKEAKDAINRAGLGWASTVVKLPFRDYSPDKTLELITKFQPHSLIPFQNIRAIEVRGKDLSFDLGVSKRGDQLLEVWDTRENGKAMWIVLSRKARPHAKCIAGLGQDEKERVREVSFLVASPLSENGIVRPTPEYLPIHVYYETKEPSPIPALLHAEFLVKGDRTALLEKLPFNDWVEHKLADYVVEFVQDQYDREEPAAYLRLLLPFPNRATHEATNRLWAKIAQTAIDRLKLPDASCSPLISCRKANLISVSVATDLARRILRATPSGKFLLHEDLDTDDEARSALKALGCREISDDDLLDTIRETAPRKRTDHEWVWTCWQWLAHWVTTKGRWTEERKERLSRVKELPLVPTGYSLESISSLSASIITWHDKATCQPVPDWLPVRFIDKSFRDRILQTPEGEQPRELLKELGIEEPRQGTLKRALGIAIDEYWKHPSDNAERFVRFLLRTGWEEQDNAPEPLEHCPISADIEGKRGSQWARAHEAYFGKAWGEELGAAVYHGVRGIPWAKPISKDRVKERSVLEWLGVQPYPRVVEMREAEAQRREESRLLPKLPYHKDYRIRPPTILDKLAPEALDKEKAQALLSLLINNWEPYYKIRSKVLAEYHYYSWRPEYLSALWWEQILEDLVPPLVANYAKAAPLLKCWLPDEKMLPILGKLLPVIDLSAFEGQREELDHWLRKVVKVRTSTSDVTPAEWRELLGERVPKAIPTRKAACEPQSRDRVSKCYEACMESISERDIDQGFMKDVPLLCRKDDKWEYVVGEPRWLADDNEFAEAFKADLWQLLLPLKFSRPAKMLFGARSLSEHREVTLLPRNAAIPTQNVLQSRLEYVKPYVFAWRRHQSSQDPEKLKDIITGLTVCPVEGLTGVLRLRSVGEKRIERLFGVDGNRLLISSQKADLSYLACAMAEALGVKTEADFYENLLRLETDEERKTKLLAKDMPENEVERYLRDFEPEKEIDEKLEGQEAVGIPAPAVLGGPEVRYTASEDKLVSLGQPIATSRAARTTAAVGGRGSEQEKDEPRPEDPQPEPSFQLKDLDATCILNREKTQPPTSGGSDREGTISGGYSGERLSAEQNRQVEERGREFAEIALKRLGYEVEQMAPGNPGFDIIAHRDGKKTLIEVKSHLGKPNVLSLTIREWEVYKNPGEHAKWELWNVENLSGNSPAEVSITRYSIIPEDAVSPNEMRVDLRLCPVLAGDD